MIITNDELMLRKVCEDVKEEEVSDLISKLEQELSNANRLGKGGIGLAAPQIGIAKNIAIIRLGKNFNFNLVNAKIVNQYDLTMFQQEGCLSFPGRLEDTMRYQEVHISNMVEPYNFVATGLLAVVCQHELDHLNQTLFMDHAIKKIEPIKNKIKVKPNQACICGSNIKYKKCCGRKNG